MRKTAIDKLREECNVTQFVVWADWLEERPSLLYAGDSANEAEETYENARRELNGCTIRLECSQP